MGTTTRHARLLTAFATFFLLLGSAQAQRQVQLQLTLRNPMPERLSDWERDPSLIGLRITNPAGNPAYRGARVSFQVRDAAGNRIVLRSRDGNPLIPSIDVQSGAWSGMFFGRNLIHSNAVEIDAALQRGALVTNSLPEGSYHFCITLLNADGTPIPTIGGCAVFTITHPRPPTLIAPADKTVFLPSQQPTFSWTPLTPAMRGAPTYRLRIVPVYQGQSEQAAMQTNPPVIDKNVGGTLSYPYSATDPSFIHYFGLAYGFAWQVSAVDASTGATHSSDVRGFTFGSAIPLTAMQNTATGEWTIQWNAGNGGGNGAGGNGGNGGKNGNLGNIGKITSDCDKPRTFRIWMNFGNMGFNTFPMEVLEIGGVDNTVADVSSDGETITVKCKQTGTFVITVKVRALPLGLSPFKDVYTLQITIDCKCGDPANGQGKGDQKKGDDKGKGNPPQGNGGSRRNEEGKNEKKEERKKGSESGDGPGGTGNTDGTGSEGTGNGSTDGSGQSGAGKEEEDPCKKLKELEKSIDELKKKIDEGDAASADLSELEDQKAELEDAIAKEKKALDSDWKTWESLGKMTEDARKKHGENSQEYKDLKRNRDNYLAKVMDRQKRLNELEKKLRETKSTLDKAKKASQEADDARRELERLSQEYEQLKKDCDKPKTPSTGESDGKSGTENGEGTGDGNSQEKNGGRDTKGSGSTEERNGSGNGNSGAVDEGEDPCEKLFDIEERIRSNNEQIEESRKAIADLEPKIAKLREQLQNVQQQIEEKGKQVIAENFDKSSPTYKAWEELIGQEVALKQELHNLENDLRVQQQLVQIGADALKLLQADHDRLKKDCDKKNGSDENKGSTSNPGLGEGNGKGNSLPDDTALRRNASNPPAIGGDAQTEIIELSLQGRNTGRTGNGAAARIDCSKITASRGTAATGGMIIAGEAGSVPPNAQITVTDNNGKSATVTAGADGSFRITEADLPDGFDHTIDNRLTVTAGGKSCTVIIEP